MPIGVREPDLAHRELTVQNVTLASARLAARGVTAGVVLAVLAVAIVASLDVLQGTASGTALAFGASLRRLLTPTDTTGWVSLGGVTAFAILGGMLAAAIRARP